MSAVQPRSFPSADWATAIGAEADAGLAQAEDLVAQLKDGSPRSAREVLELWNAVELALRNTGGLVGLLAQVHPDEAVRTLAEDREQAASRLATDLGLDRALYDVLAAVDPADLGAPDIETAGPDPAGPESDWARLLERTLRDFRRGGVDRDDATRDRLRELAERATVIGQDFSRNIRDDVRSIRIEPQRLAGLPQDFVDDHPADAEGLVAVTTDYPDVIPFRTFATDAAARAELVTAFLNRAWPDNDVLLRELLELRAERSQLLGYATWADFDAEVKMIGTASAIGEFIDRIAALADEPGRRDYAQLLARRREDEPEAAGLDATCNSYYAELVRRELFEVDAQQVRRYFDFAKVRAGLLDVTGRLFGVQYRAVPGAPSWHDDVAVYDVLAGDELRGRIYLDLHPREGKYKHAAQFDIAAGITDRQLPEGALVCNFGRGLIEHTDVVTLFHEFGHLVHHVLGGQQPIARFSGVATEWDFVEAPSQMLEEWAWDAQVLRSFANDADGEPIPEALVERMRAAKDFGKGTQARTQMFYAALSYQLHVTGSSDITATVRELQQRYDMFDYVPDTHFQASFGHLEGYSSAYYTYMWSLVIAKDMFSAFDPGDLFAPSTAYRYRDEVLARGGSGDAADLVAAFLGRPYSFESFGAWLASDPLPARSAG
jgi:thimet oligopeptidase